MSAPAERADRRRNRSRLVAAAIEVVARDGGAASMEEIARRAGVGSATLYRHFPTRRELLEAVFADGVEHLCERATDLAVTDAASGLWTWLDEFVCYAATTRGVVDVLRAEHPVDELTCHRRRVCGAAEPLVAGARAAGRLHPDVDVGTVLALAGAVAAAADEDRDAARRVWRLAVDGLRRTP